MSYPALYAAHQRLFGREITPSAYGARQRRNNLWRLQIIIFPLSKKGRAYNRALFLSSFWRDYYGADPSWRTPSISFSSAPHRRHFPSVVVPLCLYDPLSSHEIDGVRKEKERLTAVTHIFPQQSSLALPLRPFRCVPRAIDDWARSAGKIYKMCVIKKRLTFPPQTILFARFRLISLRPSFVL